MRLLRPFACLFALLLAAAPAFAGVVYVPFNADVKLGDKHYRTQVWASNHSTDILGVAEYLLLPTFADGTAGRDVAEPTQVWIGVGESRVFQVPAGSGMLEILASPDVYIHARLVPVGEGSDTSQGINLPVISSSNVVPADQEVQLLGWARRDDGAEAYSSFGLVNLGHQGSDCSVDVFRDDGQVVLEDVILSFAALSHNHFDNVLRILGQTEGSNWRVSVTCDQPFFPYLGVFDDETGNIVFVTAAASGRSELERPTEGGVSDEFDYLSDLPISRWGGIELRPFVDSTGIDFHGGSNGNTVVGGFAQIRIAGTTYEKGLSFYGKWSQTPFLEFDLGGQYALLTMIVRLDDYARNRYEWAVVSNGRWVRLERPSDGFRGRERTNPIRVGGAATFQVKGDGQVLFQGPEVYAHRDGVVVEVDVTGVQTLRLQAHHGGHETLDAPYRNGLSAARYNGNCPWWDLFSFADAKVFLAK